MSEAIGAGKQIKVELAIAARWFAIGAHGPQEYGARPYVAHLDAVVDVVRGFGFTSERMLQAAYLHDVLEDTIIEKDFLASVFGEHVARIVWDVTGVGSNRRERNLSAYQKIKMSGAAAEVLKVADRIANVQECIRTNDGRLGMYRKEHREFKAAICIRGSARPLWHKLDRLIAEASDAR